MKKSKRLQPVLQLADRNKKMAEQALANARQQLAGEQQKMTQLDDYLAEYQDNLRQQQATGAQAVALLRGQEFMSRLQDARIQQQQQINLSEQMLAKATALWQATHARYKAMESLIERSIEQEQQAEDRRLQREIDELVQHQYSSR